MVARFQGDSKVLGPASGNTHDPIEDQVTIVIGLNCIRNLVESGVPLDQTTVVIGYI